MQEKLQLKAGLLCNFTISGHKFKSIPAYEHSGKGIRFLLKLYQDSLPEDEGSVGFQIFHDIVKLLRMCGESKTVLSTYYKNSIIERMFLITCLIGLGNWN